MWAKTLRGRLTLWNLTILTLTLLLFGLLLIYTTQKRLSDQIDNELWGRARHAAHPPPRQNSPNGEMGLGPPPDDQRPPPRAPEPPPDDRMGFLRRPQQFDEQGNIVDPPTATAFDRKLLQVGLSGKEGMEETMMNGYKIRVVVVPKTADGKVTGAVEMARDVTDLEALERGQIATFFILLPLALLVGGAGALFLTNRALKPIGQATATAATISEQDLSQRLNVQGADELARLAGTFNDMLSRLQTSFERQKAAYSELEKAYENQRRFTADASHELRTPLTRLKLATSGALAEDGVPASVVESLKIADQSAESMSKIVQQLLLLSKADSGQLALTLTLLDLRVVVAEAVDSVAGKRHIDIRLPEEPVMVNGDEDHLKRVVINLVQNAMRHTPEGKKIAVEVAPFPPARSGGGRGGDGGSESVELIVRDEGEGVAPEHLPHLGERFYRVDQARSRDDGGVGLGLSICKTIVEAHQGKMKICSQLGSGTEVVVILPLAITK